jgi:hypothetical protein
MRTVLGPAFYAVRYGDYLVPITAFVSLSLNSTNSPAILLAIIIAYPILNYYQYMTQSLVTNGIFKDPRNENMNQIKLITTEYGVKSFIAKEVTNFTVPYMIATRLSSHPEIYFSSHFAAEENSDIFAFELKSQLYLLKKYFSVLTLQSITFALQTILVYQSVIFSKVLMQTTFWFYTATLISWQLFMPFRNFIHIYITKNNVFEADELLAQEMGRDIVIALMEKLNSLLKIDVNTAQLEEWEMAFSKYSTRIANLQRRKIS